MRPASNRKGGGLVMRRRLARLVAVLGALVAAVLAADVVGPGAGPVAAAAEAQVRFAESPLQVVEHRTQVLVVVDRVDLPVSRLLVHYRTEAVPSGAATAGTDYAHAAGTLVFDVGTRSASFPVWVKDDAVAEETEHLLLHLETSSGSGASTRLTILDDDLPPSTGPSEATAGASGAPAARVGQVATGGAPPPTAPPPVVVASSAGSSRPARVVTTTRRRTVTPARPPAPRRITLRQTPATPFELRPAPGAFGEDGSGTAVDPLLALGAGLLLARVGAEAWFRARIAIA